MFGIPSSTGHPTVTSPKVETQGSDPSVRTGEAAAGAGGVELIGLVADQHLAVDPYVDGEGTGVALGGTDRVEIELQADRNPVAVG